jgi:lipid-binding SYLF domain-containing protein
MNTEALSYSRSKGLFVGVAVDGAKIQQDNDSTVAFYGKKWLKLEIDRRVSAA